jgi:hypothetical protein
MDSIARIGSTIQIKGEVTSREPLVIAGKVEGTVDVEGHALTLDPGGRLDANIIAQTIVVAGAVKGSLTAEADRRRDDHRGQLGARDQPGGGATVSGKSTPGRRSPGCHRVLTTRPNARTKRAA